MFIIRIFTGSIIGMIGGLIFGAFVLMLIFAGVLVALAATAARARVRPAAVQRPSTLRMPSASAASGTC